MSVPKFIAAMELFASQVQRWAKFPDRVRSIPPTPKAVPIPPYEKPNALTTFEAPPRQPIMLDDKNNYIWKSADIMEELERQPAVHRPTMDSEYEEDIDNPSMDILYKPATDGTPVDLETPADISKLKPQTEKDYEYQCTEASGAEK